MAQDIIVNEALPYPYAHYADTFVGFHKNLGSEIVFCSCQKSAVEIHLEMCRISEEARLRREQLAWHINPYADYPRALLKKASFLATSPSRTLLRLMRFEESLCHKCNQRIPYGRSRPRLQRKVSGRLSLT